jgi:uncharacterized protein YjiS (DUF1127 family)
MSAEFTYRYPSSEEVARIKATADSLRSRALRDAFGSLVRGTRLMFEAISEARYNARVYNELNSLDERMLKDIGINRGDIDAVVRGLKSGDLDARGANENAAATPAASRPAA